MQGGVRMTLTPTPIIQTGYSAGADGEWAAQAERWGAARVISDCHFAVQLNCFIPGFL